MTRSVPAQGMPAKVPRSAAKALWQRPGSIFAAATATLVVVHLFHHLFVNFLLLLQYQQYSYADPAPNTILVSHLGPLPGPKMKVRNIFTSIYILMIYYPKMWNQEQIFVRLANAKFCKLLKFLISFFVKHQQPVDD